MKFKRFYRKTSADFFDQSDQHQILVIPMVNGQLSLPSLHHLRNLISSSCKSFFVELEIQGSYPSRESLEQLTPIFFHPDYFKIYHQPVVGLKAGQDHDKLITEFFNYLSFPQPLIISYQDQKTFFAAIHLQENSLKVNTGIHLYEWIIAESFSYVVDNTLEARNELENLLPNKPSELSYLNSLIQRNSKQYELQIKVRSQSEQIENLQLYNDRLRAESKKEIEWHQNELKNYLAWHESTKLSFSNFYRKAKHLFRKLIPH